MTNEEMGALADRLQRQCLAVLNASEIDMTGPEQRTVTFSALEIMLTNVLMSTAATREEAEGLITELSARIMAHLGTIDWPKMVLKRARLSAAPNVIM
jgi:hypothetical protein